jgi:hypothetical protein
MSQERLHSSRVIMHNMNIQQEWLCTIWGDTGVLADLAWLMLEVALAPFSVGLADAVMLMVLLLLCNLAGMPGWVCAMNAAILCCDTAWTTRAVKYVVTVSFFNFVVVNLFFWQGKNVERGDHEQLRLWLSLHVRAAMVDGLANTWHAAKLWIVKPTVQCTWAPVFAPPRAKGDGQRTRSKGQNLYAMGMQQRANGEAKSHQAKGKSCYARGPASRRQHT